MADEETTDDAKLVEGDEIKVDDEAIVAEVAADSTSDDATASSGGTVADDVADDSAEPTLAPSNGRKTREGLVASNKMDKTAVVVAQDRVRHRRYNKTMQRDKRLYVHDENNELKIGDRVRVIETRPLSKNKRWRLLEILERAR